MKFGPFILSNMMRKKTRLVLTLSSFAVALFLFGMLSILSQFLNIPLNQQVSRRLIVTNRASVIQTLPVSFKERIEAIHGVKNVTYHRWFAGVYHDEDVSFSQYAIEAANRREVFPEIVVPDAEWTAFMQDRQGAIVGVATAKRFGWKVGDRIVLHGTIFPGEWPFNISGMYRGKFPNMDESEFWFHWEYLNEKVEEPQKGQIDGFVVRIPNRNDAPQIVQAIDAQFAGSRDQTRTQTDRAVAAGFLKQIGNVGRLMLAIGSIAFAMLLLVTANAMASAVRERTAEFGILKSLGYSNMVVLLLVITESVLLSVIGGGIGLLLVKLFTLTGDPTHGILPAFYLPPKALLNGLGLSLAAGIASALLPAISMMRLHVVDALRRV